MGNPSQKTIMLGFPCHHWRGRGKRAIVPIMSALATDKNRVPERLLARLWKKKAARQEWLRTQGGARVRVIYPGSVGTGPGPDFRNALLEVGGQGIVRGDVEIHVRQKDWKSHGHGGDHNYNGVVLHAALELDGQDTQLQSGGLAPVVSLMPLLASEGVANLAPGIPASPASGTNTGLWALLGQHGYPAPKGPDEMGELLDLAGVHRFLAKREYLADLLREQSAEQTLYENLMEGLGYRYNQQPFLKLAARATYDALKRGAGRLPREGRTQALCSWLLIISGLATPRRTWHQINLRAAVTCPGLASARHFFPKNGTASVSDLPITRAAGLWGRRCCWTVSSTEAW